MISTIDKNDVLKYRVNIQHHLTYSDRTQWMKVLLSSVSMTIRSILSMFAEIRLLDVYVTIFAWFVLPW